MISASISRRGALCGVVREAGARIHADSPDSDVPQRVAARIRGLRSQYPMLQSPLYQLRPLARFVRRLWPAAFLRIRHG
jgi:hypothetical protein